MKRSFIFLSLFLTSILLLNSISSNAQVLDPNDMLLDYYKLVEFKNPQLQERLNIHSSIQHGNESDTLSWNPWDQYLIRLSDTKKSFRLLPFRTKISYNSDYSRSYNDGSVWQGRGATTQAQGGFTGRLGHLRYTFSPIVFWSQNKEFQLAENSDPSIDVFNYQFQVRGNIDYVQRFGNENFYDFHMGQSEVRGVFNWFTIGLSTQNIVFGPAQRNPIILGNSGGMMPHFDLGTIRPVNTFIGLIEAKLFWARMNESDYNNSVSTNPNQFFTAFSLGYQPKWIRSLTLGLNRVFYKRWQDFSVGDFFKPLISFNPPEVRVFGNDEFDQTYSFTMRWSHPSVGFESYMEFAKSDFGGNLWRSEPEHGRAITIGFIKLLEFEDVVAKLSYEHTTIGQPKNSFNRRYNRYYSHGVNRNGYTHNGQLIGAGIGPGSNGDWFDAKVYFKNSMIGGTMQRIRFDDDYFFENFTEKENHDFEWSWGFQFEQLTKLGRLGAEVNFSRRWGVYYIEENVKNNVYIAISFVKPL